MPSAYEKYRQMTFEEKILLCNQLSLLIERQVKACSAQSCMNEYPDGRDEITRVLISKLGFVLEDLIQMIETNKYLPEPDTDFIVPVGMSRSQIVFERNNELVEEERKGFLPPKSRVDFLHTVTYQLNAEPPFSVASNRRPANDSYRLLIVNKWKHLRYLMLQEGLVGLPSIGKEELQVEA